LLRTVKVSLLTKPFPIISISKSRTRLALTYRGR
jgi:hypothetical protein